MPTVVLYARKSSESDDRQVLSLPAQVAWATEACRKLNLDSPLVIEEARSAKTPGRPGFARLMSLIAAGEVETVVCWKADRLARNALDGGAILYALESKQLRQIVTTDRTYRGEPDEEFILTLELGLSAKYSKDLSKNIKRGIDEKLRRGEWHGSAPFGYRNLRETTGHGRIVLDPEMAPYVRELFRLAAAGNHSLSQLAELTRRAWRLERPRRRATTTKRGLSVSSVDHILKNPFYYGEMRVRGAVYAGSHEPLVTRALFEQVQGIIAGRRTKAERPKRLSYALSGLIRCAACGRRFTAYERVKRSGKRYVYYVCTKHIQRRCAQSPVSEADALTLLRRMLHRLSITPGELARVERMLGEMSTRRAGALDAERARLAVRLAEVRRQQARLLDLLLAATIAGGEYGAKKRELASAEAELTLASRVVEGDAADRLEPVHDFFRALVDVPKLYEGFEVEQRKAVTRRLGLELEADGEKLRVHAGKPATVLLRRAGRPIGWRRLEDVVNAFSGTTPST